MPDFGFVGGAYEAPSIYQDDQALINWYPETDSSKNAGNKGMGVPGDRGVVALYPRPGLTPVVTPSSAAVRALYTLPGQTQFLTVVGATLYLVNASFVATAVGTLVSSSGPVSITENGVNAYLVDGNNRYTYNWTTNTFATVSGSDGAFTGGTRCDNVDSFIIYNQPNTNQWGCTNALSTVSSAQNFANKVGYSDNIVTLISDHRQVLLLGERTSEWWTDVGSYPFPFQVISGTTMQHGCAAAFSVARLGESVAFLSHDDRGQGVVVMMNGYSPVRISNHAIEADIAKMAINSTINDAIAFSYQYNGHEFYQITFPTADKTWCYDLATGMWHRLAYRDTNNNLHRHRGNCACVFRGYILMGDYQNGSIYKLDPNTYTDNGVVFPCIRRAPHLTDGLKRVTYHDLQIQFQPGVGLSNGQGSDPQAMLKWSDDGGSTYGNEHWVSIGKIGSYRNRAIWRRLGMARDRIFEVTVTDPVYRVVVSAELNAESEAH